MASTSYAWRVHWKNRKGKTIAKSEQYAKKKYADKVSSIMWQHKDMKPVVKREKKSNIQKAEERIIRKLKIKGDKKRAIAEALIPY